MNPMYHTLYKKKLERTKKKTWTSIKKNGNITGKTTEYIKKINKSQNTIK